MSERTFENRISSGVIPMRRDERGHRWFHPVDVDHLAIHDELREKIGNPEVAHRWYLTLAAMAERAGDVPITQKEIDQLLADTVERQDDDNDRNPYPDVMMQWNRSTRRMLRNWPEVNAMAVSGMYWFFAEVVAWRNGAYVDDSDTHASRVELRRHWLDLLTRLARDLLAE